MVYSNTLCSNHRHVLQLLERAWPQKIWLSSVVSPSLLYNQICSKYSLTCSTTLQCLLSLEKSNISSLIWIIRLSTIYSILFPKLRTSHTLILCSGLSQRFGFSEFTITSHHFHIWFLWQMSLPLFSLAGSLYLLLLTF